MPSTKSETINQYCSVCKDHFDMEVVKQGSGKSVVWLKCPGCQGFLPNMPEEQEETGETGKQTSDTEIALEDLDVENAKEYAESEIYKVGDVIHHRSWNDFGKILSKGQLPGNRQTIWVQFARQGKVQLIEGAE